MNWIQENKKLAGVVGIMVAGAIGLGVWLFLSCSAYSEAREQFGQLNGQISSLESSPLYPNSDNVKAKGDKLDAFQDEVEKLRAVLLQLQQPIKPITETEFQAKLKERSTFVRQKAADAGVLLPSADFALGFEEYAKTLPKSADAAAELNVHLDAMESIVTVLTKSGIKSLDIFDRAKLPMETGGATTKAKTTVAPAPKQSSASKASGKRAVVDPVKAAEPVLDRYTVKVTFTTDQAPLQKAVNALSDFNTKVMPNFTVIRLMRIENEKSEGPLKTDVNLLRGADPSTQKPGEAAAPDAVTVMGEEMLKVFMEIDYIRFREADASAGESPASK
jgi:hypothetical protein